MNTQGGNIWVFNIIKNTGKIKLKELLQDSLFFLKEEEHSELWEAMWWDVLVASLLVFIWEKYFPANFVWLLVQKTKSGMFIGSRSTIG